MPLQSFTHDPLPDSKTHIRLIKLLQGNFGQHVTCELSTWALDEAPEYCAISYTWGDPALSANITVNGQSMLVRRNCEYVLQQTFSKMKAGPRYVWADAISIAQSDKQEKGHQVSLMGQIYDRAVRVFACVGPHSDDSEYLFSMCRHKKVLLKDIFDKLKSSSVYELEWSHLFIIRHYDRLALRSYWAMTPSARYRLTKAFLAFITRAYFTRVWVLQELHMGHHIVFCCGPDTLLPDQVSALSQLLDPWFNDPVFHHHSLMAAVRLVSRAVGVLGGPRVDKTMCRAFYDTEPQRGCLALACARRKPRKLPDVIDAVNSFECADIRDKVYGVLSLVDWSSVPVPIPDYEKDVFEFAVEVFDIMASMQQQLHRSSTLAWAKLLTDAFELTPTHPSVKAALARRQSGNPHTPTQNPHRHHIKDWHWLATKLYAVSDKDTDFRKLYCSDATFESTSVTLFDDHGAAYAYAPSHTKPGDWYCRTDPFPENLPRAWSKTALIVRGSSIVGVAVDCPSHDRELFMQTNARSLEICWDPRDALLLHLATCKKKSVDAVLGLSVCGSEGSSFARGAFLDTYFEKRGKGEDERVASLMTSLPYRPPMGGDL
jgi:hypothetical protein